MKINSHVFQIKERWKSIGKHKPLEEMVLETEFYKKLFSIFQVGKSYLFVFSPATGSIDHVSESMKDLLGYRKKDFTIDFMLKIIHPEDLPTFVDFENAVVSFKEKLPVEKLMKYKTQYNYRIRKSNGEYIHILQQSLTVQTDDHGAILQNLIVHTDISEFKKTNEMKLSFLGIDGEPSYLEVDVPRPLTHENDVLSPREREVLTHLIECRKTNDIAKLLNISPETVKTHRKNIHRKLGTTNTLQLVLRVIEKGWM